MKIEYRYFKSYNKGMFTGRHTIHRLSDMTTEYYYPHGCTWKESKRNQNEFTEKDLFKELTADELMLELL